MQRMLAQQIGEIANEECQARIAECLYRCRAGGINMLTRLSYIIAQRIHGEEKTSMLFMRFLLHAKHVENRDFIQHILNEASLALSAGKLNGRQTHSIRLTLQQMHLHGQLA